jgi:hypothetical protein
MFSVSKFMLKSKLMAKPTMFMPITMKSYHERVIDHYEKPRNVGSFDSKDSTVGTGLVGAPACGDVMKLQIRVNKESNKIEEAKFKVTIAYTLKTIFKPLQIYLN